MKLKDNFHVYAASAILFWSLAYVFTRLALMHFSVYSLGFLRYFIASGVLIVIVIAAKMKPPALLDLKWFAAGGAAGFFLYMITFNKGCETVTAATSSVIIATTPIISAVLANFIYRERLKHFQWAAIILSFSGVVILTLFDGIFSIDKGIIWLLAAAILLSFYNLLQRKLAQKYFGLQIAAFSIFAGTIMLAVFLPESLAQVKTAAPEQLFYVGIMGVFSSALGYLAWSQAFAKAKSISSVSNYLFITPFLATLLGFLIAKEVPDLPTIIGGIIIFAGLLLFNFGDKLNFCLPQPKNKL